ncbi:hypothetical protein SAMN05216582_10326 [Selenomonas ruminantium]|uniref:Uncharacterized protein n=1 Tax=Selenomonas ruminantium TaxID=971 RepID=A0A1M6RZ59_SELRU|nr:hypothetical protein [Selenomonas ruminantium]SHK37700.1 hypothetical protein SAMN05216582_10326 [Selenomonas ruminantium]
MYAKKIFLLLLAACLGGLPSASAKEAVVEGMGVDRAAAIQHAARCAVEEVVGTYIDAWTLVRESRLALDNIYTHSRGYVRKIKVLEEGATDAGYTVKALVDVNDAPDAGLMDKLTMLMLLNDPAFFVSVTRGGAEAAERDATAESVFNERLLELGFGNVQAEEDNPDFLVKGELSASSQEIFVPNAKRESTATGLFSGQASLDVTVIEKSSNHVVGTFSLRASDVAASAEGAEEKAGAKAVREAAERLEGLFKKVGAKVQVVRSTAWQGGDEDANG